MANIKWGYAINQWKPTMENLVRKEQQERAFKTMSVCGFRGVELNAGFGRWEPLGNPYQIELNFGSVKKFVDFLDSCGIDQIVSFFFDLAVLRDHASSFPSNPTGHEKIVEATEAFAKFLNEVCGFALVIRPMQSYWKLAPVTDEKLKNAAECWNKVGQMTKEYDIQTLLHTDFLCAVHSAEDLGKLLKYTNPDYVGLALDTAEAVIAGNDPVHMYEKFHDRVKLMHFKDAHEVDAGEEYKNKHAETHLLHGGGSKGVERWFWEMGTPEGLVDFPALMHSFKHYKTKGWVIVESDHSLHPPESAMCNSWYIKNILSKIYK